MPDLLRILIIGALAVLAVAVLLLGIAILWRLLVLLLLVAAGLWIWSRMPASGGG